MQVHALFSKQHSDQSKDVYVLVTLFCICGFMVAASFSFIRSNLLSFIHVSKFTETQCSVGFGIFLGSCALCLAVLHITFIRRIQLTFRHSTYEYKSRTYKILYIVIIVNCISLISTTMLRTFVYSEYNIIFVESNGLAICKNSYTINLGKVAAFWFGVTNLFLNMILLYMFNRGLWLLNKEMLKGYMNEHHAHSNMPESHPMPIHDISSSTVESLKITVHEYKSSGDSEDAVKRIIMLYNLMKKQTILVCIAVLSTTLFLILSGFDGAFIYEIGWDIVVNTICVWMMLSTSKRYWHCCKDHGCCKCCYWKTGNRD